MTGTRGRSGRRPLARKVKRARGETRPSRATTNVVAFPKVAALPDPPVWLNADGKEFWRDVGPLLVGQRILTLADLHAFAQLCQLDGRLIDKARRGVDVTGSEISQHRMYSAEFGMTPTSRPRVGGVGGNKKNPFDINKGKGPQ